jgi:ribonuclease-3
MQARHLALPNYQLIQSDGQQHKQQFTIALSVTCCKEVVEAVGSSKKQAQQLAAEKMLSLLENIDSQ